MKEPGAILVSGAAGGIGRAVCKTLASAGYHLILLARSDDQLADLVAEFGQPVVGKYAVDLSDLAEVEKVAKSLVTSDLPYPIVGLAACAGLADGGPIEAMDAAHYQRILATNSIAPMLLAQAVIKCCRKEKTSGRLVFVNSVEGYMTFPFVSGYSASKHALEAFTAALRLEHSHEGIWATSVIPGFVATPIWDKAAAKDIDQYANVPNFPILQAAQDRFVEIGRSGLAPEKVALAVLKAFVAKRVPLRIVVVQYYLLEWIAMRIVPLRVREYLIKKVVGFR